MRGTPLAIAPSDPRAKFLLFAGLEILLSKEGVLPLRDKNDSFELEIKTMDWPLWAPHVSESADKEGVTVLTGVIGHDY